MNRKNDVRPTVLFAFLMPARPSRALLRARALSQALGAELRLCAWCRRAAA